MIGDTHSCMAAQVKNPLRSSKHQQIERKQITHSFSDA